jgi:hypothetical protein
VAEPFLDFGDVGVGVRGGNVSAQGLVHLARAPIL